MIHVPEDGKRKIGEVTDNSLSPKPPCGPSKSSEERAAGGEEFSGNLSQSTSFLKGSQNKKYTNSTMLQKTIVALPSSDDLQPPEKIMCTDNNKNGRIAAMPEKQSQQESIAVKIAPRDAATKSKDGQRESDQETKHNTTTATPSKETLEKNLHNQAPNANLQHYYPQHMINSAGSTGVTTMVLNTSTAAAVPPAYILSTQGAVGHHHPHMFLGQHPHQFPHQLHQQPNYPHHHQLHSNIAVGGNTITTVGNITTCTVGGGAPPLARNQFPPRKVDARAAVTDIEGKDVTCSTEETPGPVDKPESSRPSSAMPRSPPHAGATKLNPSPAVSNEVSTPTHQKHSNVPPGKVEAGQEMLESVRHASLGNVQQGILPQAVGSAIPNQQLSSTPSCNDTGVISYGPAPVSTMAVHNNQIVGGATTLMQPQPNYEMVVMPTYQPQQVVAVAPPALGYPQMVPSQTNPSIVALPPYALDQTALCGMAPATTFGHPGATYFPHPGPAMAHTMPTYFPGSQMQAYPTPAYPIVNSYPSPCLSSFPNGAISLVPGAVGIHGQHHQQQAFNMNSSNQDNTMYPILSSQACNPTLSNTICSQGNVNTNNGEGNQTATKNQTSEDQETAIGTYKRPPRRRRVVKRFEERFRDLMKFKDRYGHCDVPHKWKEDLSLGKWCSNIRISYKSVMKGEKPAIHILPGQIKRLNAVGFKWSFKRCV